MKRIAIQLTLAICLCIPCAADDKPSVDQEKLVPAGNSWLKEIQIKMPGDVKVNIDSKTPMNVAVVAERSYKALIKKDVSGISNEDIVADESLGAGENELKMNFPKSGNYWFIIFNKGAESAPIRLRLTHTAP